MPDWRRKKKCSKIKPKFTVPTLYNIIVHKIYIHLGRIKSVNVVLFPSSTVIMMARDKYRQIGLSQIDIPAVYIFIFILFRFVCNIQVYTYVLFFFFLLI